MEISADPPFTISKALSHGICTASDGSVWDNKQGAHGWAVSTNKGERCVAGMVLVKGADPGSFCAEASGMLPTLCYLVRLAKFTGYFDTWMGVVATDNFTLLDAKLFKPASTAQHISILACNEHIPKDLGIIDVQSPEWDLVNKIPTILQKLPGAYLQFVPGHQDRKVAYAKLPFLAPLNVDANAMATWYQQQHPHIHTKVLLTNTAGIHLHMPQGSITSRYSSPAICYQATYGPLMAHIQ